MNYVVCYSICKWTLIHDDDDASVILGSDTRVRTEKNPVGFLGTPT